MAGIQGQERLREFLSRLSPVLDPVSYSLTDDGLGPLHELHVPRNMVMLLVAGLAKGCGGIAKRSLTSQSARDLMRTVYSAETTFQSTQDDGRYGTLEELAAAGLLDLACRCHRDISLNLRVSGNKFEATAVPRRVWQDGISFLLYRR